MPTKPEATPDTEQDQEKSNEPSVPEYPSDMPPEMYVPFQRAKSRQKIKSESHENNLQFQPLMQTLDNQTNKPSSTIPVPELQDTNKQNESDFPIPMDFDISDPINESDMVPQFKDLDFDTPIMTEPELTNETTKYLAAHNIEYEIFRDFVATEKYVIYEHNDPDFWVMDDESWFAAGKQKDSPIPDLISLAKENDMTPVLYLAEQNIMDIDETIKKLESNGVRVIKSLSELD